MRERGKRQAVLKLKMKAEAAIQEGYSLSYVTAALYTALNDHQKALDMLELAYEKRDSDLVFLNVDPLIAPFDRTQVSKAPLKS